MIAMYENREQDFYARHNNGQGRKLQVTAHLHHHIEMVLMMGGTAVGYADSERCVIEPGDLFIVFPNHIHHFDSTENEENYYIFIVSPDLVPDLSRMFVGSTPRSALVKGLAENPEVLALANRILSLPEPQNGCEALVLRGYLTALFATVLSHMTVEDKEHGEEGTLRAIISYCIEHYKEPLSLSVLESRLHISKYYISHLFSDKLRISFNDYINSLRISFACNILRHQDLNVTEVAGTVGFGTLRTFNRAFVKFMGVPPSEYRRNHMAEIPLQHQRKGEVS